MKGSGDVYPAVDLTNCDREPIHIIGTSQSHGVIIACSRKDKYITQCSENALELLGINAEDLLGQPVTVLLPEAFPENFPIEPGKKELLPEIEINGARFLIIVHISGESYILDFEPLGEKRSAVNFQKQLSKILNELNTLGSIDDLTSKGVSLVKTLFGYDRVMIYQFDEEWNGMVIAEEKNEDLESWLGLHYPATDIPKPSRDLFLKQEIRIISNVHYDPAQIIPALSPINNKPLDLSLSELRGVSPIHIEYLKNMGVGASLTAAIVIKGKLWGLLACHHYSKKYINYYQRQSVKFLTQIFTNSLNVLSLQNYIEESGNFNEIRHTILKNLRSQPGLLDALITGDLPFTKYIPCSGGAVFIGGELSLLGNPPEEEDVLKLIRDFLDTKDGIYHTRSLEKVYPPARNFKKQASGILSVKLGDMSGDYLIWFRGENATEVSWGGNPEKQAVIKEGVEYLSPRKSFEKWTHQVSGVSTPWKDYEIEAVNSLSEGITHIIVSRQKEAIRQLNSDLKVLNKDLESFNYSVSHDLRAPLRGISGFVNILKDNNYNNLNAESRRHIDIIQRSANEMHTLIDALLSYSRLGKTRLHKVNVDVLNMVELILENLNVENDYPRSEIIINRELPSCEGDRTLLHQLFSNLIENALKYSAKNEQPKIEIGYQEQNNQIIYFIKDNGIGIDPKFSDKIFNVFLRLAGDEYPGTGVGLATVQKVIEKHNGKIWVESALGEGSVFYFILNSSEIQIHKV